MQVMKWKETTSGLGSSELGTAGAGRGSGKAMSAAAVLPFCPSPGHPLQTLPEATQISGLTPQSCFYGPRLEC